MLSIEKKDYFDSLGYPTIVYRVVLKDTTLGEFDEEVWALRFMELVKSYIVQEHLKKREL